MPFGSIQAGTNAGEQEWLLVAKDSGSGVPMRLRLGRRATGALKRVIPPADADRTCDR
jgi:hypothetical protein